MALAKNPRFCGVELQRDPRLVAQVGPLLEAYRANVHGSSVILTRDGAGWQSEACVAGQYYLRADLHASSAAASLLSLRGALRNLHNATERMLKRSSKTKKGAK
jgi:hypothetical protein